MKLLTFIISITLCAIQLSAAPKTDYEKMAQAKPEEKGAALLGTKWHAKNAQLVADTTTDECLEIWLSSKEKCDELLSKVQTGYQTKPIDAILIAAVTQYVMRSNVAKRELWVKSIISRLNMTMDSMIAHFYLDQLRWCASQEHIPEIKSSVSRIKDVELKKFLDLLIREIKRDCPGLK
ncbi:MAG: hypothetical protein J6S51_03445 [Kiritimatiellae bacterium]|nr:hypothetical protein [Kiritimatiellia bacterium]